MRLYLHETVVSTRCFVFRCAVGSQPSRFLLISIELKRHAGPDWFRDNYPRRIVAACVNHLDEQLYFLTKVWVEHPTVVLWFLHWGIVTATSTICLNMPTWSVDHLRHSCTSIWICTLCFLSCLRFLPEFSDRKYFTLFDFKLWKQEICMSYDWLLFSFFIFPNSKWACK